MSVCVLQFLAQSSKRSIECINDGIILGGFLYYSLVFFFCDLGIVIVVGWRIILPIVLIIAKIWLVKDLVIARNIQRALYRPFRFRTKTNRQG